MNPLRSVSMAVVVLAALAAAPARGDTLFLGVSVGPNSDPATQDCGPRGPLSSGAAPIQLENTCTRADVGSATGHAVAAAGHLGAAASADSHNGNSLIAGIGANSVYSDFIVFHSTDPNVHSASVSANLVLDGVFEAGGPFANGFLEMTASVGGTLSALRILNGSVTDNNGFAFDAGQVGAATHLLLHTGFVTVALDSPVGFDLRLQASATASGPGSHGAADFDENSLKLRSFGDAFTLPAGVTVNAGSYLVDNRYLDPLAPVPEPPNLALMLAGAGCLAVMRRRGAAR